MIIHLYSLAVILLATQLFAMFYYRKNAKYVIGKIDKQCDKYTPPVLLTVPCKGLDTGFEENIKSFLILDYPDFIINFVVESSEDAAYKELLRLKQQYKNSQANQINVLIAGLSQAGSQKNHNLLYSIASEFAANAQVLVFADSDARVEKKWLRNMVDPLHGDRSGASTGYRWILPAKLNFASFMLSSLNGMVGQYLGKTIFNQVWGGSMAIRKELFFALNLDKIWANSISDDLSLTYAVKKAQYRVRFAPVCLVATYEQMTAAELLEFGRRQFLITRKTLPLVWLGGFLTALYGVFGVWGSLAIAIKGFSDQRWYGAAFMIVFLVFAACRYVRINIRHNIASEILSEHRDLIRKCKRFDYITALFGSEIMLLFILSALLGNTITWRGRKYRIKSSAAVEQV